MTEPQRTTRLGCFTASQIGNLMKSGRAKGQLFGDTAMTYIYSKIAEYITGEPAPSASAVSMDFGKAYEKDAAMWLQQSIPFTYHGAENFIYLEYNQFAGGSPDGLSEDAVIELKVPYVPGNHVKTLIAATMNTMEHNAWLSNQHPDYYAQLQFNMLCADKHFGTITRKGIYATYDPRTINPEHRMAILYIERDEMFLDELKMRIEKATEIVTNELTKLNYLK